MRARALRWVALGLLAFVVLVVVSGVTLTSRGKEEMQRSDGAFHDGDLRTAIFHAKKAALSFVPGADHVERAYQRLEAIGRGAEAQGNEELARIAWEALRGAVEETDYPGRPATPAHQRAAESLERLRAARGSGASD